MVTIGLTQAIPGARSGGIFKLVLCCPHFEENVVPFKKQKLMSATDNRSLVTIPEIPRDVVHYLNIFDERHLLAAEKLAFSSALNDRYLHISGVTARRRTICRRLSYTRWVFLPLVPLYALLVTGVLGNLKMITSVPFSVTLAILFLLPFTWTFAERYETTYAARHLSDVALSGLTTKLFAIHAPQGLPAMIRALLDDYRLLKREIWGNMPANPYAILSDTIKQASSTEDFSLRRRDCDALAKLVLQGCSLDSPTMSNFSVIAMDYLKLHPATGTKYLQDVIRRASVQRVRDKAVEVRSFLETHNAGQTLLRGGRRPVDANSLLHLKPEMESHSVVGQCTEPNLYVALAGENPASVDIQARRVGNDDGTGSG